MGVKGHSSLPMEATKKEFCRTVLGFVYTWAVLGEGLSVIVDNQPSDRFGESRSESFL